MQKIREKSRLAGAARQCLSPCLTGSPKLTRQCNLKYCKPLVKDDCFLAAGKPLMIYSCYEKLLLSHKQL